MQENVWLINFSQKCVSLPAVSAILDIGNLLWFKMYSFLLKLKQLIH